MILNIPDELTCEIHEDKIKFKIKNVSSNWMSIDDSFINRITSDKINCVFVEKYLVKEISVKNILDEGLRLLSNENYLKAIEN